MKSLWNYIPIQVLHLARYLPTAECRRLHQALNLLERIGRQFIQKKLSNSQTEAEGHQDIMNILMAAYDPKRSDLHRRLSRNELFAQINSVILAGHETTSSTLNFMFWELAKRPDYQSRTRHEIMSLCNRVPNRSDSEYTLDDVESMLFTVATVKETSRLYPVAYHISREAARDDTIPLSEPVTTAAGGLIYNVPVSKGQTIIISLCGYNRLPSLWGDDADVWNPERFFNSARTIDSKTGLYANLMSFSGGIRACIGWRMAILQIMTVIIETLKHFEFSLPDTGLDIVAAPNGPLMSPYIRDKMHLGPQMPLVVRELWSSALYTYHAVSHHEFELQHLEGLFEVQRTTYVELPIALVWCSHRTQSNSEIIDTS
ncbi:hypothetical protein CERSUDRAFT_159220 [Gelatoporia subvermispora B]|uniref:Cytochrome P450 n=1 Tax=Ceriporiopsis subvermispora (strain B) TaxID=914234 RepID=M2QAI1_CERS8|nr:hypothetical protein CERSUDRAFT_159220 [Gelatoporia subvermispora B]